MLIYLDSAQFAWLERATAEKREAFRKTCLRASVEIVVSLEHLIEIGQLGTLDSALARTKILSSFPCLRSSGESSAEVVRWEIQQQLAASIGRRVKTRQSLQDRIFPRCSFRELERAVADQFPVFQAMQRAFEEASHAEALGKAARTQAPASLRAPLQVTAAQAASARALLMSEATDPQMCVQLESLFDVALAHVQGRTMREALLSMFGLSDLAAASRAPESDLTSIAAYLPTAEEVAAAILGPDAPAEERHSLARAFDPYECRGIRLRLAANRARRPHPGVPVASDQLDESHVIFAPYVDLMFVDKRTRSFLQQEARKSSALCYQSDLENIVVPRTLEQVMDVIDALAFR